MAESIMRAFSILTAAILIAIGIGVGVEIAVQPTVYSLDAYSFAASFPGAPVTTATPQRHAWVLEYHGIQSPPDYRVLLAIVGPPLKPGQFPSTPNYVIYAAPGIRAGHVLPLIDDIPSTPSAGGWRLPRLAGFSRSVSMRQSGPSNFRFWIGTETVSTKRIVYIVQAESPRYSSVRAFLNSFAPIS